MERNISKYHSKIHNKNCSCKFSKKFERNEHLLYIIEQLYTEKKWLNFIDNTNDDALDRIFRNSVDDRKLVSSYFNDNIIRRKITPRIRQTVRQMKTICFCGSIQSDEDNSNAGTILMGSMESMSKLVELFNTYVTGTEFNKLVLAKVSQLKTVNRKCMSYNMSLFVDSDEIDKIIEREPEMYTVFGLETDTGNFSFSFGKREWMANHTESSLQCSKRELFEEFNIHASKKVYKTSQDYSILQDMPMNLFENRNMLFFLYVTDDSSIEYCPFSDTMFIE